MTDTQFGIQFVVTRNGEPITDVITVENTPILLHEKHDKSWVMKHQRVVLVEMISAQLKTIDMLAGVVPDARPVGLPQPSDSGFVKEKLGVPVLKVVNRALVALNKRLAAYNAKRGKEMRIYLDGVEVTGEATDLAQALRDAAETNAKRGPYDVG